MSKARYHSSYDTGLSLWLIHWRMPPYLIAVFMSYRLRFAIGIIITPKVFKGVDLKFHFRKCSPHHRATSIWMWNRMVSTFSCTSLVVWIGRHFKSRLYLPFYINLFEVKRYAFFGRNLLRFWIFVKWNIIFPLDRTFLFWISVGQNITFPLDCTFLYFRIWMGWIVMSSLDRTSFLDLDGADRYVFVGLYLLFGFGWGGSLCFHWTVPAFLWSCLDDFLLVVHLGFIIMQKKEFVNRKIRKF